MATVPTPGTVRPAGSEPDPIGFIIGDTTYRLDLEQLTSTIEKELYDLSGLTVAKAVQMAGDGASFGVQAIIYLSRRCGGETVTYDECAISFGDLLGMTSIDGDPGEDPDYPLE